MDILGGHYSSQHGKKGWMGGKEGRKGGKRKIYDEILIILKDFKILSTFVSI